MLLILCAHSGGEGVPRRQHHETTLPVTHGRLDLGTWQRIFYAEFDGQRAKRVIVKVLGKGKD